MTRISTFRPRWVDPDLSMTQISFFLTRFHFFFQLLTFRRFFFTFFSILMKNFHFFLSDSIFILYKSCWKSFHLWFIFCDIRFYKVLYKLNMESDSKSYEKVSPINIFVTSNPIKFYINLFESRIHFYIYIPVMFYNPLTSSLTLPGYF